MSQQSKNKVVRILGCALELLKENGDQGLTMRQVALRAGMSLSNVQYYFKNKEALLSGLLDYFLDTCLDGLEQMLESVPLEGAARFTAILAFLIDNPEMEPICQVLKEIWAIAGRNPILHTYLTDYYRKYLKLLSDELQSMEPDCPLEQIQQAVALALPMIEGYAVTRTALPLDASAMATLISTQVLDLIGHSCKEG